MSYRTNCGGEINPAWRYCTGRGAALGDVAERNDDSTPPPPRARDGFLSYQPTQFVRDLVTEETSLDRESREFARLSSDVRAALQDFAMVAGIEEVDILRLLWNERRTQSDNARDLIGLGLLRVPALYDRAFRTDWEEDIAETIDSLMTEIAEDRDDISLPPVSDEPEST